MRSILIITFCLICSLVYSQEKQAPVYYVNSVKYATLDNIYINPQNIDSIYIKKETLTGEIYIKTNQEKLNFITIEDILKKHSIEINSDNQVIYLIDGGLIFDASNVKIDDTYFIDVKTQNLAKATYLEKEFRKLVVVMISLSQEEFKPRVVLRGNDVLKIKEFYY